MWRVRGKGSQALPCQKLESSDQQTLIISSNFLSGDFYVVVPLGLYPSNPLNTQQSSPCRPTSSLPVTLHSSLRQTDPPLRLLFSKTSLILNLEEGMLQEKPCAHPRRTVRAGTLLCEAKYNLNKREISPGSKMERDLPLPFLRLRPCCDCKSFPFPF